MNKRWFESIVDNLLFKARMADVEIIYNDIAVLSYDDTKGFIIVTTDSGVSYISVIINSDGSVDCFGSVNGVNLMGHYNSFITKELSCADFSNNGMFVTMERWRSGYRVQRYYMKGGE